VAVRNWESGKEIIVFLLDWQGVNILITKEVVKAAIGNF